MFQLTVEREFCAAHALVIGGVREPVHGHNFRLTATVEAPTLDADGLVMDFHALERVLDAILAPMHNADLNALPAFATSSPSAERIVQHVGDRLVQGLARVPGTESVRVVSVRITEAPGCTAAYFPSRSPVAGGQEDLG